MAWTAAHLDAAQTYEERFVPALFHGWTRMVLERTRLRAGDQVLDVACGTGVLARAAEAWVGPSGQVTGLDINEGMLAVATRMSPSISWRVGSAEHLPFADASFHAVVSQFGLMFFPDAPKALQDMHRVLRPGGMLVVAVWDALENQSAYAVADGVYQLYVSGDDLRSMRDPYVYGDPWGLACLFGKADIPDVSITTHTIMARFSGVRPMVLADIDGWLPHEGIHFQERTVERIVRQTEEALASFILPDGMIEFPISAHIATASKEPVA